MTTTITKVTEQCSPLQCFEDVVAGQTIANTQGADAYTECRCSELFSPEAMTIPLLFGAFVGQTTKNAPDFSFLEGQQRKDAMDAYREVSALLRNKKVLPETAWFDWSGTIYDKDVRLIGRTIGTMSAFRDNGVAVGIYTGYSSKEMEAYSQLYPDVLDIISTGRDGKPLIRTKEYTIAKWVELAKMEGIPAGLYEVSTYREDPDQFILGHNKKFNGPKIIGPGEILVDDAPIWGKYNPFVFEEEGQVFDLTKEGSAIGAALDATRKGYCAWFSYDPDKLGQVIDAVSTGVKLEKEERPGFDEPLDARVAKALKDARELEISLAPEGEKDPAIRRDKYRRVRDIINELIAEFEKEPGVFLTSPSIAHDAVIFYKRRAELSQKMGDHRSAEEDYFRAAVHVAGFATTIDWSAPHGAQQPPRRRMDKYDIETFIYLIGSAVQAQEAIALERDGSADPFDEIRILFLRMENVLEDADIEDSEASEWVDKIEEMKKNTSLKKTAYIWLDDHVPKWRDRPADEVKGHFERVYGYVAAASQDDVTAAIKKGLKEKKAALDREFAGLTASWKKDRRSVKILKKMVAVKRELARLHYETGELKAAAKMKTEEIRLLVRAGDLKGARIVCAELINMADVAGLYKSAGDGYLLRAHIDVHLVNMPNADRDFRQAIIYYKRAKYRGPELPEARVGIAELQEGELRTTRAIGVEGAGQLGAIGAKKKGEEGGGHEKKERKGKERPGK